jgi:O-antigen/teichoic acid export membrane protein
MASKRRIIWNIVWNSLGTATLMGTTFVLAPFLIYRLGDTTYGLWIVLGSLTSSFGLLDLGVRGAVGRHVAFHHAREDHEAVCRILATAQALLFWMGLIAAAGVMIFIPLLPYFYDIPPEVLTSVRVAQFIVALNLGFTLLFNSFDAALWGLQRFDLINGIDIPSALVRTGLTFLLVSRGGGLVSLAAINLGVTVAGGFAKGGCTFWISPWLRLGRRYVCKSARREIFGHSIWCFIRSMAEIVRGQLSPLLIGSLRSLAQVTPYSIANRLTQYGTQTMRNATGVLVPMATALHAKQVADRQRRLFYVGGKYCMAFSLFLGLGMFILGPSFIILWTGERLRDAIPLLLVLATGEVLPNSQWISNGMIFAAARHWQLALLNLIELVLVGVFTVVLLLLYGPIGACYAIAIPGILFRGVAPIIIGSRLLEVRTSAYLWKTVLPACLAAATPAALLVVAVSWHEPKSWPEMLAYMAGFGVVYLGTCVLLFRSDRRWRPAPVETTVPEAAAAWGNENGNGKPEAVVRGEERTGLSVDQGASP